MSRGPGRVERAIADQFDAEPDQALTTEELCERIYPSVNRIEKRHRVAVIRAAGKVCARMPGWLGSPSEGIGSHLIWWNKYDVRSYALFKIKRDFGARYRSKGDRIPPHWRLTAEVAQRMIEPGGKWHDAVVEGGSWWRHVQIAIADRDDDTSERAQELHAQQQRDDETLRKLMRRG